MSGHSSESPCPKCGKMMLSYFDWKPVDIVDHQCLHCGFILYCTDGRMTLTDLNSERKDFGMKPLKKLPKWKEED